MRFTREAYIGDVTALASCRFELSGSDHDVCFAGIGPVLLISDLIANRTAVKVIFNGARIHGIQSKMQSPIQCWLLLYGDHFAQLCSVEMIAEDAKWCVLHKLSKLFRSCHWILDCQFHPSQNVVLFGLSNNSVQVLSVSKTATNDLVDLTELFTVHCSLKIFLFSMSIHIKQNRVLGFEVSIASGTAFNHIFIWGFILSPGGTQPALYQAPYLRLEGHSGGILRLKWIEEGSRILSVSEDRTFALWEIPQDSQVDCIQPSYRKFGHKARIWDIQKCDDVTITCSEDCTFKLWRYENGELLNSVEGHVGQGIWRCLVLPNNSLITGGADGSIQIWSHGVSPTFPSQRNETQTFQLKCPVNCLRVSRNWIGVVYCCTDRGTILATQKTSSVSEFEALSASKNQQDITEIYKEKDFAGSFVCCSIISLQWPESQNYDVFIAGHSKGHVQLFMIDKEIRIKDCVVLKEANEKPVLTLSSQSASDAFEFWISVSDCSGSMICYCLSLLPNQDLVSSRGNPSFSKALWSQSSVDKMITFELTSPLKTRLVCISHFLQEDLHLAIAGDTHGSILVWRIQYQDQEPCPRVTKLFKRIHGKQPIGMISSDPARGMVYSAARNFCIQQYCLEENAEIKLGAEWRLRDISTAEYIEFQKERILIGGFCQRSFCLSDHSHAQLLIKLDAGGRNRKHDFALANSSFCFGSADKTIIELWTSSLLHGNPSSMALQELTVSHHGEDINDVQIIQTGRQDGRIYCLTGSEDGRVKSALHLAKSGCFHKCQDIGISAVGTSVKSVIISKIKEAYFPTSQSPAEKYLCVSVGSKQVIMTWILDVLDDESTSKLISVKPPARGGFRPSSYHDQTMSRSDLRFLAAVLVADYPDASMILSSSDASLGVYSFDQESQQWHAVSSLVHHHSPVLCLDSITVSHHDGTAQVFAASGSTDGTVCFWDITEATRSQISLHPVVFFTSLHQSGVNTLALTESNQISSRFVIVSGGDDQSISVVEVLEDDGEWKMTVLHSIPTAHSSAVRDLRLHGDAVFSIGLDQRLIAWILTPEGQLHELSTTISEVPGPSSLDVVAIEDVYYIAIAGRGLQLMKCHLT